MEGGAWFINWACMVMLFAGLILLGQKIDRGVTERQALQADVDDIQAHVEVIGARLEKHLTEIETQRMGAK